MCRWSRSLTPRGRERVPDGRSRSRRNGHHVRCAGCPGVAAEAWRLETLLGQAQVGEHGAAYLVDGAGQILASAPVGAGQEQPGGPHRPRRGPAGRRRRRDPLPCARRRADDPGLRPGGILPTWAGACSSKSPGSEVIGPVLRYSQFMPLVAALAAIVSLLTLYYGVRAIVRPLQALGQQAERVAWGDFEATSTPVGGVEEIEDLRRTLDQMARRIQSYQSGMHDYIAAITQGQEEERKRLARELHDDTAQALIALRAAGGDGPEVAGYRTRARRRAPDRECEPCSPRRWREFVASAATCAPSIWKTWVSSRRWRC